MTLKNNLMEMQNISIGQVHRNSISNSKERIRGGRGVDLQNWGGGLDGEEFWELPGQCEAQRPCGAEASPEQGLCSVEAMRWGLAKPCARPSSMEEREKGLAKPGARPAQLGGGYGALLNLAQPWGASFAQARWVGVASLL